MGNWFTDGVGAVADGVGEVVGSGYDMVQTATGGDTRAQQEIQQQQEEARAAAEWERQQLATQQRGLETQGTDPASIQQHDNWEDWDHQRLVTQLRDTLDIEQLSKSGQAWQKLGEDIAETFAELDKETRAAAGDGMQGEAAEAGLGAAKPLQDWGKSFGDSLRGTGMKVQEISVTADQTKQSIQPPTEGSAARTLLSAGYAVPTMGLSGIADAGMRMKEASEDEKRARAVAQNTYTPGYTQVDQSTPSLPPPVDPLNPPPPPPGPSDRAGVPSAQTPTASGQAPGQSSAPSGVSPSGVGAGSGGDGGANVPNMPGNPAQSGSAWNNPPHGPGSGMPHGPGAPEGPGGAPGGMAGGMVGGMAGAGAAGGVAAGAGMGGAGGAGRAGAAGGGMGAGGRAGAGAAGSGAGAGAGAAGSGGSGGARGGAMGGGAGAGRGGGQGDDEYEHDRPTWLEEQDDVWLEDMPRTAPAVFGE